MNPKQRLKLKADRLVKEVVIMIEEGICEVCGSTFAVTAHHFFPRSLAGHMVYDLDNLVCLCRNCHFAHHTKSDPRIHQSIIEKNGEIWYNKLLKRKQELHASFKTMKWYQDNIIRLGKIK